MKMVGDASDDVIAPLISLLAEVPNEYSFASGSASTDGLKQMTNALVSDEQNIIFRDIVSRSKSLLAAMGMVMKSTSVNLNPNLKVKNESNFTENPLKWTTPQVCSLVYLQKALSLTKLNYAANIPIVGYLPAYSLRFGIFLPFSQSK